MKQDSELLRRSMDAAPGEWLDRLVAERVMLEVRRECAERASSPPATASARAKERARAAAGESPLGGLGTVRALMALLAELVPPGV